MFSAKNRIIWRSMTVAGVFLFVFVGCDSVARHKVLTFFFEGVPPLGAKKRVKRKAVTVEKPVDTGVAEVDVLRQRVSSKHSPSRDDNCGQCHLDGSRSRDRLVNAPPDLCYSCHTNYSDSSGYLHGPIAAGACVFCHGPHTTKFVHLQKKPQPKLCYQCHQQEDIALVTDHQDKQHEICTKCHDPHAGSRSDFLKVQPETKDDSNSVDLSE